MRWEGAKVENYRRAERNVELLRLRLNQGWARAGHLTWITMMILMMIMMMIMVMMMKWYDNMMITRGKIVHNMVTPLPRASHLPPVRISPDPEISDFVETPNFLTPLDFLASPSWYPSTPWFLRKLLSLQVLPMSQFLQISHSWMYYTPLLGFLIFSFSDNFLQKYLLYQQNLKKETNQFWE